MTFFQFFVIGMLILNFVTSAATNARLSVMERKADEFISALGGLEDLQRHEEAS